jgi:hypothetical protein
MTAKMIVIKTADGAEETLRFTERTVMDGWKKGEKTTALVGEEGTSVVIRYTKDGTEKVADAIKYVGRTTLHVTEGTVERIGRGGKELAVKTADGAEEVFYLGERAIVDTTKGVADATAFVAKKGEHVVVHYTTEAGKKVAHLVHHGDKHPTN